MTTRGQGYGRQRGHSEVYRGAEYTSTSCRRCVEVLVDDDLDARPRGDPQGRPDRRSATARSGPSRSTTWCGSAPARWAPTPSEVSGQPTPASRSGRAAARGALGARPRVPAGRSRPVVGRPPRRARRHVPARAIRARRAAAAGRARRARRLRAGRARAALGRRSADPARRLPARGGCRARRAPPVSALGRRAHRRSWRPDAGRLCGPFG